MVQGSKIIIVRHTESVHNVTQRLLPARPTVDRSGRRAGFTYFTKATFGLISSALRRAIQTALTSFSWVLNKKYFDKSSGQGIDGGATFSLNPDLQERSDLPCDTGSSSLKLAKAFPGLSFGGLGEEWLKTSGRSRSRKPQV